MDSIILWVHDERFSPYEVVVNPSAFPTIVAGDLLEVFHASNTGAGKRHLVVQVPTLDEEAAEKQPHLQISIAQHLAALFELQPRAQVVVRRVEKDAIKADFMELAFKDQYVARSDMWKMKMSLLGTCVYKGKKIQTLGVRAQVKDLVIAGRDVSSAPCAYITESTKLVFRSHSAKFFIFIQMSREMWDFEKDGELFFEKCVHGFLPNLFLVWKKAATNHVVSIVLFSRIYYITKEGGVNSSINFNAETNTEADLSDFSVDMMGNTYRDFYRVVVDWETRSDWADVLVPLKREFVRFEKDVLQAEFKGASNALTAVNSPASEGNILEAINLALNPFDKHYIDRDLSRTGLAIVVITASPGLFYVDKHLLRLTTQRCVDNGIACDLVSLAKPPLFSVPLFQFFGKRVQLRVGDGGPNSGVSGGALSGGGLSTGISGVTGGMVSGVHSHASGLSHDSADTSGTKLVPDTGALSDPLYFDDEGVVHPNDRMVYFNIPTWLDVSFFDRSFIGGGYRPSGSGSHNSFTMRCRLPDASVIAEENEPCVIVDLLDPHRKGIAADVVEGPENAFDRYDSQVFASVSQVPFNAEAFADVMPGGSGSGISVGSYGTSNASKQSLQEAFGQKLLDPLNSVDISMRRTSLLSNAPLGAASSTVLESGEAQTPDLKFDKQDLAAVNANSCKVDSLEKNSSPRSNLAPIRIASGGNRHHKNDTIVEKLAGSYKGSSSPDFVQFLGKASPGKQALGSKSHLRQNYINPCNPTKNIIKASSTIRRWQHVFPLSHNHNEEMVKWKSLSTPASLPISTDYFPSQSELVHQYTENTYTVTPDDEINPYQDISSNELQRVEALLMELISQRISQGFQIIVSHAIDKIPLAPVSEEPAAGVAAFAGSKFWAASGMGGVGVPGGGLAGAFGVPQRIQAGATRIATNTPYYLSLGDHLHKLFFDASFKNVEVKKYTRKMAYSMDSYSYRCMIWPKNVPGYMETRAVFSYPPLSNYAWNYLDHLIAGYLDDMTEALRFWRARFLLIPLESVQNISNPFEDKIEDEDLRIAGFNKFVELFEKARWQLPGMGKRKEALTIQFTTLKRSQFVRDEWNRVKSGAFPAPLTDIPGSLEGLNSDSSINLDTSLFTTPQLTKNSTFLAIVAAMQDPLTGVPIKDRNWHSKVYKNIFIGRECINWMVRAFSDISTREEAVAFGNELCVKGVFEHANQRHRFLDGYFFYRVSKDYMVLRERETSLLKEKEDGIASAKASRNASVEALNDSSAGGAKAQPIDLSRRMVVDMDPLKRSTRKEMAILHYDTIHNPKHCYHFQLHWLVCTPRLIEDLLQGWSRTAERCGFKFVEAPIDQARPLSNDSPFQSVVSIELAISPPKTAGQDDREFLFEIARQNQFVVDVEAEAMFEPGSVTYSYSKPHYEYTQFVHRTGAAFVQVIPGKGFLWVNNRLFLAAGGDRLGGSGSGAGHAHVDNLRSAFTKACSDKAWLEKLWSEMSLFDYH
ncbi:hypothetical protein BC830DRAFT_1193049 [Chytriomyces sp. MP71]|nr:hypothetical protein BC830DRAFT_1193049 [Chytriomyces sp. MP71]